MYLKLRWYTNGKNFFVKKFLWNKSFCLITHRNHFAFQSLGFSKTSTTMFSLLCLHLTQWMQNAAELQSTYVATSIVNGLCSVIAVTCNLVVILVIVRNSLLHTPSYVLLCNLAVSDLGVGPAVQPVYIALIIAQLKEEADLSCKFGATYLLISVCLGFVSFFTVTAISVDRFLAVYLAIKYRSTVTVKKAKFAVVSIWLITITVMIIFLVNRTVYYTIAMIVMNSCLLVTSCNYIAIGPNVAAQSRPVTSPLPHPDRATTT